MVLDWPPSVKQIEPRRPLEKREPQTQRNSILPWWSVLTYILRPARQAESSQEVRESGIGVEDVEFRFYFEMDQKRMSTLIGLFQPSEGLLFIAKSRAEFRHMVEAEGILRGR